MAAANARRPNAAYELHYSQLLYGIYGESLMLLWIGMELDQARGEQSEGVGTAS